MSFWKAAWLLTDRLLYGMYLPDHRNVGKQGKAYEGNKCVCAMAGDSPEVGWNRPICCCGVAKGME